MISLSKRYQTKQGAPVRILCTDRRHAQYPVVGLIHDGDTDYLECWTSTGERTFDHRDDLVEVQDEYFDPNWQD